MVIFNSRDRLTAEEAVKHKWLLMSDAEESAMEKELRAAKLKLKRYVIKKRWAKAVSAIIALKRMGAKINTELQM